MTTADLDAILVILLLVLSRARASLFLGLTRASIASTTATAAATTTFTTSPSLSAVTLLLSLGLLLLLLGALNVLMLALLTEAALATLLKLTADLLLTRGVFGLLHTISLTLVLLAMEEAAAFAEAAGFLLLPVVTVALWLVVTLRDRDRIAFRVLVLAIFPPSALAIVVTESPADLLGSVSSGLAV